MTTLLVTYAGAADTPFDRNYYVLSHLPLVQQAWAPHGLESIAAFFPAGDGAGTIAICVCGFRDEASLQAALHAPQTQSVMADVPRFTGIMPVQSRAMPL